MTVKLLGNSLCGTPVDLTSAAAAYTPPGSTTATMVPLAKGATDTYSGSLPAQGDNTVGTYKVTATLPGGKVYTFPDNPGDPSYQYYSGAVSNIYCTDFEGTTVPADWTHTGTPTTADEWEWGTPGEIALTNDPRSAFSGTNLDGLGKWTTGVTRRAEQALTGPMVSTTGRSNVRLQYRTSSTSKPGRPIRRIYANGTKVEQRHQNHTDKEALPTSISRHKLRAAEQIRFELVANGTTNFGGWNIDDFCIVSGQGDAARLNRRTPVTQVVAPVRPTRGATCPRRPEYSGCSRRGRIWRHGRCGWCGWCGRIGRRSWRVEPPVRAAPARPAKAAQRAARVRAAPAAYGRKTAQPARATRRRGWFWRQGGTGGSGTGESSTGAGGTGTQDDGCPAGSARLRAGAAAPWLGSQRFRSLGSHSERGAAEPRASFGAVRFSRRPHVVDRRLRRPPEVSRRGRRNDGRRGSREHRDRRQCADRPGTHRRPDATAAERTSPPRGPHADGVLARPGVRRVLRHRRPRGSEIHVMRIRCQVTVACPALSGKPSPSPTDQERCADRTCNWTTPPATMIVGILGERAKKGALGPARQGGLRHRHRFARPARAVDKRVKPRDQRRYVTGAANADAAEPPDRHRMVPPPATPLTGSPSLGTKVVIDTVVPLDSRPLIPTPRRPKARLPKKPALFAQFRASSRCIKSPRTSWPARPSSKPTAFLRRRRGRQGASRDVDSRSAFLDAGALRTRYLECMTPLLIGSTSVTRSNRRGSASPAFDSTRPAGS